MLHVLHLVMQKNDARSHTYTSAVITFLLHSPAKNHSWETIIFSLYKRERRKDCKQIRETFKQTREALLRGANTMGRTDIRKCYQQHLQKDTCTNLLACTLTKKGQAHTEQAEKYQSSNLILPASFLEQ